MTEFAPIDTRRRPRLRWWVAGVVVLLIAACAWTGVRALKAKQHLEQARTQLEQARSALLDRRLDDASAAITAAAAQTVQARRLTHDAVTGALSLVPVAGRSLDVLRGVTAAADEIARDVLPPALEVAKGIDPAKVRQPDGRIDIALLRAATPGAVSTSRTMAGVARDVDALPTTLVPSVVGTAARDFDDQVTQLNSALRGVADALRIAPDFLGADHPRRWFVLVQQTSESRGTGGLPGGFAVLSAVDGRLKVENQGSNADLPAGVIAPVGLPKDYVDRYQGDGAFENWQNSNLSPDLPVVSRYLVQRWKAQTGEQVDGVLAVDAVALQTLLEGSGPVEVAPGQTIPASGIEDYLALGQYAAAPGDNAQYERKENLTSVTKAVLERLTGGGGDSTALLRGLSKAVRSGHLHLGTDDKAIASVLAGTGADGGLPRDGRPFTYPVVFNASGSTLVYFQDRTLRYTGGDCGDGRRRTTVSVTLRNDPPALNTLPQYVTIRLEDGIRTQSLVDRVGLSVYATRGARLVKATLDGKPVPYLEPGTEAGLPVWQTFLDLPPQADRTLVLTLDEPTAKGAPRVLEQPLARPLARTVDLDRCS
jgi:hypothetical protein